MVKLNELRIGVFVCDCGSNIAGTVDKYTCADPGQMQIQKAIAEYDLNRVVVASCTPKIHEPTFRNCLKEAGLNPYLLEMANIREHVSWVHQGQKKEATEKAMDLVASAVARCRFLEPQTETEVPVTEAALVIGAGVAGIQAALDLADAGHNVYLVEKEPSVGGIMAALDKTYPTMDCSI